MLREQFLSEKRALASHVLAESQRLLAERQQWQPDLSPDDTLPIEARRDEVIKALQTHQVIVVSGETGSGKTTQLPRYALAAGFGRRGLIGHTQPRRLAARAVAARVAEQTGTALGKGVGYAVRFDDKTGPDTLVRMMTDGILLNELARDRLLLSYEVLIIDEAHERSLNIDFLLGLLATILPKRPDLRVIITSATIDHQRFAAHFNNAPVIEVSGRGYPVDVLYEDLTVSVDDSRGLARHVCNAVKTLQQRQLPASARDILVFLPGEREIRDTERALHKSGLLRAGQTEVLPLFGRLSDKAQQAIFSATKQRRIVLATNVAETSLTVPRIGAVIDSGLARLSRYSARTRVQRLQLEPVSKASANQRAGRCGRIGPGVCIRLFGEEDFDARPDFTDAEIVRTNLASVVLQMAALRLGDIEDFPFLDRPDVGQIDDAHRLLFELGAIDEYGDITKAGRQLSRLPLDPRLARMLLNLDNSPVSDWLVVIVAGLSVQDPRQRPMEQRQLADAAHQKFADASSDFITLANLWRVVERERRALGRGAFERWCDSQFLSPRRLREWREVAGQLARQSERDIRTLALDRDFDDAMRDRIHQRVLAGLLSQVGALADKGEYEGAMRRRFRIHPSSVLASKSPKWVMALEIVQTQKRYARYAASIDNSWLTTLARHVIEYDYEPPYWNARKGRVEAKRTSLLFGLVVRANERIDFSEIDRDASRDVFLRQGLVADQVRLRLPFIEHNRNTRAELAALEGQLRKPLEINEADFAALFAARLPDSVVDTASLKKWLKKDTTKRNALLSFSTDMLMSGADVKQQASMPSAYQMGGNRVSIDYRFSPESDVDGASLRVPLALLASLRRAQVDASVPAYLAKRVEARLRRLPKATRKQLQPLAACAERLAARLISEQERGDLDARLQRLLLREFAIEVASDAWNDVVEAPFLRPRIVVLSDQGKPLAADRDLSVLQNEFRQSAPAPPPSSERQANVVAREWQFGALDSIVTKKTNGVTLTLHPALKRLPDGVTVEEYLDAGSAARSHAEAVVALLSFRFSQQLKQLRKSLLSDRQIALLWAAYDDPGAKVLIEDFQRAALLHSFDVDFWKIRSADAFMSLTVSGTATLVSNGNAIIGQLHVILEQMAVVRQTLAKAPASAQEAIDDIAAQADALVHPGFLCKTPPDRLNDIARYLEAAALRVDRFASNPSRDHGSLAMVLSLESRVHSLRDVVVGPGQAAAVSGFRWDIEELRVSLFAQSLGTRSKVSVKRLEKRWDDILRMQG